MTRVRFEEVNWHDMAEIPYRASRLMKTLGNPKAYALVQILLEDRALTVQEIADKLHRSQQAVSIMLRSLRDLEVVRYQRREKNVIYALKDPAALRAGMKHMEEVVRRATETAPRGTPR
jgi:DNA-binding transcriptional ArsR family regulator